MNSKDKKKLIELFQAYGVTECSSVVGKHYEGTGLKGYCPAGGRKNAMRVQAEIRRKVTSEAWGVKDGAWRRRKDENDHKIFRRVMEQHGLSKERAAAICPWHRARTMAAVGPVAKSYGPNGLRFVSSARTRVFLRDLNVSVTI